MNNRSSETFQSPLGELMAEFVREKRACGYRYVVECRGLRAFDAYLWKLGHRSTNLERDLVEGWTARRSHESPRNHEHRLRLMRQFAGFLIRRGVAVHLPDVPRVCRSRNSFTPYIFSTEQIAALRAAADSLPVCALTPNRHRVMPELFRLLWCCGMRHGEVRHLRCGNVDLEQGVLTVLGAKFQKDRLVPLPRTMQLRLRRYMHQLCPCSAEEAFFPGPYGEPYSSHGLYKIFRYLLRKSGIPHGGRGRGPRIHDIRHSYAVHRLERWYREGVDLGAKLPLLATYMGHQSIEGTQTYLRLTPHLFPDVTARMDQYVGHVIPRRTTP